MALTLTNQTKSQVRQAVKEPNIVFEIEGVSRIFGASLIQKKVKFGDPGLKFNPPGEDGAFKFGGFNLVADQANLITFDGTSTSIRQQLNIDKGEGGSVSKLAIALMETDYIRQLITPGALVDDILNKRCKIYLGFKDTGFPEDYITIFRGFITDIEASSGRVILDIAHPDEKKRSNIFKKIDTELASGIDSSATTITLLSTSNFLERVLGPDGEYDPSFKSYVLIGNELIEYTEISGNTLTGCTRGQLFTSAASHSAGAQVSTFYRLKGNGIDLALKLMASGEGSALVENIQPTSYTYTGEDAVNRAIYFEGVDLKEKYGLSVGDYVSSSGSENELNNFTNRKIVDIVKEDRGEYVVVEGPLLGSTPVADSVVSFRSQYDTLPDGLRMFMDEIDVEEHLRLFRLFLSSVEYDFYIKDGIEDAKEFIEKEIYSPMAAFSIPRKARSSIGYHIGPIPGSDIKTFDKANIKKPTQQRLKRSISNQFYNEVLYKYDERVLEEKFDRGYLAISGDSKARIKGANKTLVIESKGLRTVDSAENIAQVQGLRRLKRYEFGAETLEFSAMLDDSFAVEIGDIIIYDGQDLKLPDTKTGISNIRPRFYEVQQKSLQLKTGDVSFMAVDTGFDGSSRYGLISPSSKIANALSSSNFVLKPSYGMEEGQYEFRKWERLFGPNKFPKVKIRNADFSVVEETFITGINGNLISVEALSFTPDPDMVMELADYSDDQTDQIKLMYAHMEPDEGFEDGTEPYVML